MNYEIKPCVIFLLFFILVSCTGYDEAPCVGYNCQNEMSGGNYGTVNLTDSNSYWLSSCPEKITLTGIGYTNSQGFVFKYNAKKSKSYYDVKFNRYEKHDPPCCPSYFMSDYYNQQEETIIYNPQNGGLTFSLLRNLDVKTTSDSLHKLIIISKKEYLLLNFNSSYYEINTDSTYVSSNQVFHPTLSLRGKNYNSVFEIIDTKADTTKIVPQGFYFSFKDGLIGYYLTNKELWAIQ